MPARKPTKRDAMQELGLTGLQYSGGKVREEWQADLKGAKRWKTYAEMRVEPSIATCLTTLKQLVKAVPVNVEDGSDETAAELVRGALDDMSHTWSEFMDETLTFLGYGFSLSEICYKLRRGDNERPGLASRYDDGRIGWRKFAPRSQDSLDRWEFDDEGGIQAFHQTTKMPASRVEIPIEKLLLFKMGSEKNNPEPAPLIRAAYIPWKFLKQIRYLEGVGVERGYLGIPHILAPTDVLDPNAPSDKRAIRNALEEIGRNLHGGEQSFVLSPSTRDANGNLIVEVSLLATDGRRSMDTRGMISGHRADIMMALLCDFILLGHEKVGSFALADNKTSIVALAVAGWLDSILAVLNRHAIPRLLRLNGLSVVDPPRFVRGDVETPDLGQLSTFLATLVNSGVVMPTPEIEERVLSLANLPTPSGEATVGKRRCDTRDELEILAEMQGRLADIEKRMAA